jgi:hypothetical protein
MKEYLSIIEASKLVGKHEDTIRKFVKENESKCRRDKNHKNAYLVPKDLIMERFGGKKVEIQTENSDDSELIKELRSRISYLEKQVEDYKNREIANDQRIDNLVNTLSKSLDQQQQLAGLQIQAITESENGKLTGGRHNEVERITNMNEEGTIKKEEESSGHKWSLFRRNKKK